ncbi:MAG: hypothetical protein WC708_00975 [Lentisphaeria bacterium]|jgi:hypothetical protein
MKKSVTETMKNYIVVILVKTGEESVEQRLFIVKSCLDIELFTRLIVYMLDCNPVVLGEVDLHLKKNVNFSFFSQPLPPMFVNLSSFIDPERFTDERVVKESVWCLLRAEDAQLIHKDWKSDPRYAIGKEILAKRDLVKKNPSKDGQEDKEDDDVYYANKVDHFAWMSDKRWPGQFKLDIVRTSRSNKRKNS